MRRIAVLFLFAAHLLCSAAFAQNFSGKKQELKSEEPARSLREGERLYFSLEWLGISVGNITLSVEGSNNYNGADCYEITGRITTNRVISRFYDFEYTVKTYVDKKSFATRRFEKTRRIGKKITNTSIDFDWEKKKADFKESGDAPYIQVFSEQDSVQAEVKTDELLTGAQDLLSSLYYLRIFDLREGQDSFMNVYYGQSNWPITVKVSAPFKKEMRKKGTFIVLKAELVSKLNKAITGNDTITVYFTADSTRTPVEFKFGSGLGAVQGRIRNIP